MLRYFSRLMPLLLEWLHAFDHATALAALQTLHVIVKHTWPRVPPHAALLWRHLKQAYGEQTTGQLPTEVSSSAAVQSIQQTAELLVSCGGIAFREALATEVAVGSCQGQGLLLHVSGLLAH